MPNKPPLDTVIVSSNGYEHSRWQQYELDSDLFIPADDWSMTLATPIAKPEAPLRLWQKISVRLGNDVVLTGRIDRIQRRTVKGERSLSLSGRDMAGILCDCSAPIFTAQNVTLETVVSTIAKAFGLGRVDITANGLREKVTIEPGMSAWDAIALACEMNGCHAWFTPDGSLVVGGPDYTTPPVATLVFDPDGEWSNILSLDVTQNIAGYYSDVTVLAQAHGTTGTRGKHAIKEAEADTLLMESGIYRPKIVVDGDAETAAYAAKRARKLIADGKFSALTIQATVRGHRAFDASGTGPVWTPGQRVRVISPPDYLDDIFFLSGRTFTGNDTDGQKTRLTLKLDNVWFPDAGKRKKGSKAKGVGETVPVWMYRPGGA